MEILQASRMTKVALIYLTIDIRTEEVVSEESCAQEI